MWKWMSGAVRVRSPAFKITNGLLSISDDGNRDARKGFLRRFGNQQGIVRVVFYQQNIQASGHKLCISSRARSQFRWTIPSCRAGFQRLIENHPVGVKPLNEGQE